MEYQQKYFFDPPREYSIAPFWFWNDGVEPSEIRRQLGEMFDKGVYECVVHARKGMEIGYLSEEWFDRVGITLAEAKRLGMKVWIYDENNWPSGYADGGVIRANAAYSAKCLSREKIYPVIGKDIQVKEIENKRIVSVIAVHKNEEFFDITDYEHATCQKWHSETLQWEVHVYREEECLLTPTYSDTLYVDLLNPDVTDCFIKLTHCEYKKRFGEYFGNTIKGFFVDEPGFYQNYFWHSKNINTVAWTPGFPKWFLSRYGYDIMPYICMLWEDMGDLTRKIRHDYYEAISIMYRENFFRRIYDFCEENGLQLIGHSPREEFMHETVTMMGHFFRTMDCLHIPGIDRIDREKVRVTERLGASAAHLYGKNRCCSETYGCFGWSLTPQEMKREADWQYVQGINMMIPHAFFSSVEGFRLTESPPSLFDQNIYWPHFKLYADYMRRLSYVLSVGRPLMDALLYFPMTSVWEKYLPIDRIEAQLLDRQFIQLTDIMFKERICFDIADDMPIGDAKVVGSCLEICGIRYKTLVVPPVWNIPLNTLQVLDAFVAEGGTIISIGGIPTRGICVEEDTEAAEIVARMMRCGRYHILEPHRMQDVGTLITDRQIYLPLAQNGLFVAARTDEKNEMFFVVNQSEKSFHGMCILKGEGCVEKWNAEDGSVSLLNSKRQNGLTSVELYLEKDQSAVLMLQCENRCIDLNDCWDVSVNGCSMHIAPGDLANTGISCFSGEAVYKKKIYLPDVPVKALLKLGQVCDFAQLTINGKFIGARLWSPFDFDISAFLQAGENELQITVGNTLSNKIDKTQLPAGLIGPVMLEIE